MNPLFARTLSALVGSCLMLGSASAQDAKAPTPAPAGAPAKPAAKAIGVGSPAPALATSKFVKGNEVKGFESGKVYVVEFWATWCGPCKATIPHLTEMAKKTPKANFIGVAVWERGSDIEAQVTKFVKTMGDKMDYNIAMDDGSKMAETWMTAADQKGIPTAFVVDGEGKIAWIGHPMDELDRVVQEVVDGKFDVKAEAERVKAKQEKAAKEAEGRKEIMAKVRDLSRKLKDAQDKSDWKGAVTVIDEMASVDKARAAMYSGLKFDMLQKFDKPAAYAFARTMADNELKNDANGLNTMAWRLVENDETEKAGFELAMDLSKKSNDLTKNENGMFLDTLAYCFFRMGDVTKAIELQEKAVKLIQKMDEADEEMVSEVEGRLEKFRKAKN
ncbi:MAG: TlpA family protein disulfide reductase [Phycisphaerales bacterium]